MLLKIQEILHELKFNQFLKNEEFHYLLNNAPYRTLNNVQNMRFSVIRIVIFYFFFEKSLIQIIVINNHVVKFVFFTLNIIDLYVCKFFYSSKSS